MMTDEECRKLRLDAALHVLADLIGIPRDQVGSIADIAERVAAEIIQLQAENERLQQWKEKRSINPDWREHWEEYRGDDR